MRLAIAHVDGATAGGKDAVWAGQAAAERVAVGPVAPLACA